MNYKIKIVLVFLFALVMSCAKNPFTGKSTMAFVPNSQIFPSAFQQYGQFLAENKVIKGTTEAKKIETIGMKIKTASERWLNANGHSDYLEGYSWEYNLVDSKEMNAWCMPGGKIVFYTGILPVCKDDAGIAAVMGHEVAHALANHGQQRMSAAYIQQGLAVAGNVALSNDQQALGIFNQSYGIVSNVAGMLPFSRSHETEADKIGIYLMAIAGYNPDEASVLWERMKANSGGQAPPEFLSTHPSNDSRIANLKSLASQAKSEANKFGVTSFRPLGKF